MNALSTVTAASAVLLEWRLDLAALGLRPGPFGSAMVTILEMFGITQGFAPIARRYDAPLLVLVGELGERPVAVEGRSPAR